MSENIKRKFIYQHRNCQRLDNVDSTLKDFYNHNVSKINFTNGNYFLLRRLSICKYNIYIHTFTYPSDEFEHIPICSDLKSPYSKVNVISLWLKCSIVLIFHGEKTVINTNDCCHNFKPT